MPRPGVLALILAIAACAPTPQQQAAALSSTSTASAMRARDSRRFDTTDQASMLRAAVATLQDLGYTIEETQAQYGIIVGSKQTDARIRVQIVLRPSLDRKAILVRVTFQRIILRPGAMPAMGEELTTAELYQGFFEKLSQSAFLTAQDI